MLPASNWAWPELLWRRLQPEPASSSGSNMRVRERDRILFVGSVAALLNIHQATVERGAAPDVGQPIGGERIDVAMILRQLVPAYRGRQHHAGPHHTVHSRHQRATAALVENAYAVAILDSARTSIFMVQKQCGRLCFRRRLVAESGVHTVVALGRNQFQRK